MASWLHVSPDRNALPRLPLAVSGLLCVPYGNGRPPIPLYQGTLLTCGGGRTICAQVSLIPDEISSFNFASSARLCGCQTWSLKCPLCILTLPP